MSVSVTTTVLERHGPPKVLMSDRAMTEESDGGS